MKIEEFRREMELCGFTLLMHDSERCPGHSWDKSIRLSCFRIDYEVDEFELSDGDWHASFDVFIRTDNGGIGRGIGLCLASGSMGVAFIESVQSLISNLSESAWKHLSEMTAKVGEAAMTGFIPGGEK